MPQAARSSILRDTKRTFYPAIPPASKTNGDQLAKLSVNEDKQVIQLHELHKYRDRSRLRPRC